MTGTTVVRDEGADRPLRSVIGALLEKSRTADLALGRVRLAALDLAEAEVRGPERCRVLLGQLDAAALLDARPGSGPALRRLADWLSSDRLDVRSAGIGAWTPDFSIYRDRAGLSTCLIGAHYFGHPQLTVGPSVTVVLEGSEGATLLQSRFDEVWQRAHDVAPAILEVLRRAAGNERYSVAGAP